ncbi:uncharacterized protein LOC135116957 [Helicoverpa armigera]|uniref:uncharacterized protein LOC135116957 n=1 Tax=Helicoverpa armigera TaxID=29058 RepID=UPI0030829ADD
MIDDLPAAVQDSCCLLFADDLKLSCVVRDVTDHEVLQENIDKVTKWSKENKLYFNVSKCSVMSFTRARNPRHHRYEMEGEPLKRVEEVRDLGVCFSTDLNFRKHVVTICSRAYRNLGFILRQAHDFNNMKALQVLYDALVRSHLEYCAAVWGPSEAKYKFMLERIQNKFARFLYLKLYRVYPGYPLLYPTLFVLGMVGYCKLETRREVALASYLFKVLRGKICNPDILGEIRLCVPDEYVGRRLLPPLLEVPRARTNLLQRAPLTRAVRTLNAIANRLDLFTCSLNDFTVVTYRVVSYESS